MVEAKNTKLIAVGLLILFCVIGIFTAIFAVGYALIWVCIYFSIKAKTDRINRKLRGEAK